MVFAMKLARHGERRVAKAVLIAAVPPLMMKTPANPGGLPKDVFDTFETQLAAILILPVWKEGSFQLPFFVDVGLRLFPSEDLAVGH
jgi:hypothetical protein